MTDQKASPDGQETTSRRPGRPDFQPTDDQRTRARELKAAKATNAVIARELHISPGTLRKYFAAELGKVDAAPVAELDFGGAAHKVSAVTGVVDSGDETEHQVTRENRRKVRLWALADWSEARMARQLDIGIGTLREHYADELDFGADAVATQTLMDLENQSRGGKTAASGRLLELYKQVVPPGPSQAADAPDEEPLGKKEQAKVDAQTAHKDTDWGELMVRPPAEIRRH